jgi:DNA-binding response OmpR family regulator
VVLRAGQIVEGPNVPTAGARAEFIELDATREDIVSHDPSGLPPSASNLPTFDDVPPVLRHALIVDDNRVFRRFLRELLTAQGFTIHEAGDAAEGLRLALEQRPWLILSDVRMAGQDGFAFCEQVRSHALIRQTPFLFLSGWDDYKARYHGLEIGADDFLSKDTSVRELLMRMQLVLRRHLDLGRPDPRSGMEGSLQVMGAPGVLQVCHLTRLTGTLIVEAGPQKIELRFRAGEIVGAESPSNSGEEAVYDFLAWDQGRFRFVPGRAGAGLITNSPAKLLLTHLGGHLSGVVQGPAQQPEALHLLVQGGREKAQRGRGPALIAGRRDQGRLDELSLIGLDPLFQGSFGYGASR